MTSDGTQCFLFLFYFSLNFRNSSMKMERFIYFDIMQKLYII